MAEPDKKPESTTRLLKIEGTAVSLYQGRNELARWDSRDGNPIDGEHVNQLLPEIYNAEWSDAMEKQGRKFPKLIQPGDARIWSD